MPQPLNTEFNYRYMVIGETVWEKIKTLKGFLEGRIRAAALEEVDRLKYEAKKAKLDWMCQGNAPLYEQLELEAEIVELESHRLILPEAFKQNQEEIAILKRLLAEAYEIAEPTRIEGYTDDQMFDANALHEFTVKMGRDIQAEIMANGRPNVATLRNALSVPYTFKKLMELGLIPKQPEAVQQQFMPVSDPQFKLMVPYKSK
jgi:hypothetical protein